MLVIADSVSGPSQRHRSGLEVLVGEQHTSWTWKCQPAGPLGTLSGLTLESMDADGPPTTSEYVRQRRVGVNMSVEQLASRAGVEPAWLAAFEEGRQTEELTYELLLRLVRATELIRPEWWDEGHEHDLHLGADAMPSGPDSRTSGYWSRIRRVRAANRSARVQP